jgi:hypothetical protein
MFVDWTGQSAESTFVRRRNVGGRGAVPAHLVLLLIELVLRVDVVGLGPQWADVTSTYWHVVLCVDVVLLDRDYEFFLRFIASYFVLWLFTKSIEIAIRVHLSISRILKLFFSTKVNILLLIIITKVFPESLQWIVWTVEYVSLTFFYYGVCNIFVFKILVYIWTLQLIIYAFI